LKVFVGVCVANTGVLGIPRVRVSPIPRVMMAWWQLYRCGLGLRVCTWRWIPSS
jgi:hypothetical protein